MCQNKQNKTNNSGNFEVLDDSDDYNEDLYISAWIAKIAGYHGVGRTVWKSRDDASVREEDFRVSVGDDNDAAPTHKYELCLELVRNNNKNADTDDEATTQALEVGWSLRVDRDGGTLEDGQAGPDAPRALSLLQSARSVESQWHNLVDHYVYLRTREALAGQLGQHIQQRVVGWTILEATLVVLMAVGQVWYWKKFLETRRYL